MDKFILLLVLSMFQMILHFCTSGATSKKNQELCFLATVFPCICMRIQCPKAQQYCMAMIVPWMTFLYSVLLVLRRGWLTYTTASTRCQCQSVCQTVTKWRWCNQHPAMWEQQTQTMKPSILQASFDTESSIICLSLLATWSRWVQSSNSGSSFLLLPIPFPEIALALRLPVAIWPVFAFNSVLVTGPC